MIIGHSLSGAHKRKDCPFVKTAPDVLPPLPEIDLPEDKVTLVTFQNGDITGGMRLSHTQDGTPVGLWYDPNDYRNVFWNTCVRDFTKYSHLEFWMYSENATGARFTVELRGEWKGNVEEPPYFRHQIVLTWKGWRHYAIDLTTLDGHFGGDMHDIHFVGLHATRWENEIYGVPGSFVYLSDVYLTRRPSAYTPDESLVTEGAMGSMKARWKEVLIGRPDWTKNYPMAAKNAQVVGIHGATHWKKMQKGDTTCLWADFTDMSQGHHVQQLTERLFYMARAYATYGSEYYQNEELLSDIVYGLDWVYEHGYGEKAVKIGNWWQWDIGIPLAQVKCLLLIEDKVSSSQISHWLSTADRFDPYPAMTEANRIWISYVCILSSLLQRDVPRLVECLRRMQTVFCYVTDNDGFYEDGSFIQHTNSPYIGGYGTNYLENIVDFFYVFKDTPLEIPECHRKMLIHHFSDAFAPFIYKGVVQKSVCGRGTRGDGKAARQAGAGLKLLSIATKEEQEDLFGTIHAWCDANEPFHVDLRDHLSAIAIPYYEQMMATPKKAIKPFARMFNAMDRLITQSEAYCATLAFSTSRIVRYESINEENKYGWYQGEGSLAIVTDDIYAYDGHYYAGADPYRFPGTTVTDVERAVESVVFMPCGTYAFGGGVHSGSYAMAGTHIGFEPFNFPWHYGFSSDLDLKKSWFFFPEGILVMGAGITCSDGNMVYTVVENRKCTKPKKEQVYTCDGEIFRPTKADRALRGISRIYNPDFGTYAFFDKTDVWHRRHGDGNGFFELLLRHGKYPQNEGFAYLLLPGMDDATSAKYMENPPVKVLKNTPEVMIATHEEVGILAYTFFEATSAYGVTPSLPCVLMTQKTEDGLLCQVCEATHMHPSLTLNFEGEYALAHADEGITVSHGDGVTYVSIDTNGTLGKVNTFALKKLN